MRNYGINYDTGLTADGHSTRKRFDDAVVQRELQIIASDLHATAVRVSGDDPQRLARAGQHALAAGLELWFSPVPINLEPSALPGYLARCADEAERLRQAHEGRVVLVLGCEISLWCAGFLPGGDSVLGRIEAVTDPALQHKPDVMAALASGLERARYAHRDIVRAARAKFAGLTYAAGPWETVDGSCSTWSPSTPTATQTTPPATGTRCAPTGARQATRSPSSGLLHLPRRGRPRRHGAGMITDVKSDLPLIPGTYERDEEEQVRHLHDMLAIYETEHIDSALRFTFAGSSSPGTPPTPTATLISPPTESSPSSSMNTAPPTRTWPKPKQAFGAVCRRLRPRPAMTEGEKPP